MKKVVRWGIYFLLTSPYILARAGGAGGGSSSSRSYRSSRSYSSSSGGSGSGNGIINLLVFLGVILFIIYTIVLVIVRASTKSKAKKEFKRRNSDFELRPFKRKVKDTFKSVQYAWEAKDLKPVRNYISDAVYHRFNTQIMMMNELKQSNNIKWLSIRRVKVLNYELDGDYDVVYVKVVARMIDRFKCELDSSLNRWSIDKFTELWVFMRKRGSSYKGDISKNCPNCGGLIEGVEKVEVARCPYCKSILNSGEYDWVLSEIYQNRKMVETALKSSKKGRLKEGISKYLSNDRSFSRQGLEDKASTALVQIDKAKALRKPELVRRFVVDDLYNEIVEELIDSKVYLHNVYYFIGTRLINIWREGDYCIAQVKVLKKVERVVIEDNSLERIDGGAKLIGQYIYLKREMGASAGMGGLKGNNCPCCGGILDDTIDTHCPYCKELIVDPKYDWLVYKVKED